MEAAFIIGIILGVLFFIAKAQTQRKQAKLSADVWPKVQVKTYKGNMAYQTDAAKMLQAGWHLETSSTRKQAYSLATGVFTRKGITTVTWIMDKPAGTTPAVDARTLCRACGTYHTSAGCVKATPPTLTYDERMARDE